MPNGKCGISKLSFMGKQDTLYKVNIQQNFGKNYGTKNTKENP